MIAEPFALMKLVNFVMILCSLRYVPNMCTCYHRSISLLDVHITIFDPHMIQDELQTHYWANPASL